MSRFLICLLALGPAIASAIPSPVAADTEGAAIVRIRGGYDLDENYALGEGRGPLFGVDAAFAAAQDFGGFIGAIVGESTVTGYTDPTVPAAQRHDISLELKNKHESFAARATSAFTYDSNDQVRASETRQRVRLEYARGGWTPYLTAEGGYFTLNETSGLIGGAFLPQGQRWLRGTLIPGVKAGDDKFRVGAAMRLSVNRYTDEFDDFGFARDNDRHEPILFATLALGKFEAFASISRLDADWRDGDFLPVRETMFDTNAAYDFGMLSVSGSARKVALDTTFPLSPLILATLFELRADLSLKNGWSAFAFGRDEYFEYVETELVQRTKTIGAGVNRSFDSGWTAGAEMASASSGSNLIDGETPALIAFASLSYRFGGGPIGRQAVLPSPADLSPGQGLRARNVRSAPQ